jgi:hypothetical protein
MRFLHKSAPKAGPGEREANSVMSPLFWMLGPWLVCALAVGTQFWRLTALFRKHRLGIASRTKRWGQLLERIGERDQQVVQWTS